MENISKLWGDNRPQTEQLIDCEQQEMQNFFHQEDTLRSCIIDKHHDSNIP